MVDLDAYPEYIAALEDSEYGAQVERGIVLRIEALDWNCPQHIMPRFTEEEFADMAAPLLDRIHELEARLQEYTKTTSP